MRQGHSVCAIQPVDIYDRSSPWLQARGFAKKAGKDAAAKGGKSTATDTADAKRDGFDAKQGKEQMDEHIAKLKEVFNKVRVGRAVPAQLESIPVNAYGHTQPLKVRIYPYAYAYAMSPLYFLMRPYHHNLLLSSSFDLPRRLLIYVLYRQLEPCQTEHHNNLL